MNGSRSTIGLGLVANGDCGIAAAAKAGKIRTIKPVDDRLRSIVSIYVEFETIVYGA